MWKIKMWHKQGKKRMRLWKKCLRITFKKCRTTIFQRRILSCMTVLIRDNSRLLRISNEISDRNMNSISIELFLWIHLHHQSSYISGNLSSPTNTSQLLPMSLINQEKYFPNMISIKYKMFFMYNSLFFF